MERRRPRWLAIAGVAVTLCAAFGSAACDDSDSPTESTPLPATATATPAEPTATASPAPTAVAIPGIDVPPSPLVTAAPPGLPAGWTLFAWHLGCFQCDGSFADFRRWTSDGSTPSGEFLFGFTEPPAPAGSAHAPGVYTVAFDSSGSRIAAGLCTKGYCGGMAEPSDDATAELFRSDDGGRSWRSLGDLGRGAFVEGFLGDEVVVRQSTRVGDRWEASFLTAGGQSLGPPDFDADSVVLDDARGPVWVRYERNANGDVNHLRSTYQDAGGVVTPPLAGTDAILHGVTGTDGYIWELYTKDADGQGTTVLAVAGRAGEVRQALRWDGKWWSIRNDSHGRYLVGYGADPSLGPAPAPFIIDLETATLTPLTGLPRSSSETFTYPMAIVPAP